MSEITITSEDELKKWLQIKPGEWSAVIALRSALRIIPFVSDPVQDGTESAPQLTLPIYRAMAISSGAAKIPPDDMERRTAADASAAAAAADAAYAYAASAASAAADASAAAASASAAAADAAYAYAASAAAAAAFAAADAAAASAAASAADIWRALSSDYQKLSQGQAPTDLLASPLWESEPDWYRDSAQRADRWLRDRRAGFEIWSKWYDRVRTGKAHAFDRFDQDADQVFHTRLIDQDNDWWERDAAIVNADIAGWVEDLRGPPPPPQVEEQVSTAPIYETGEDARAQIAPLAGNEELSKDEAAQQRHQKALERVQEAGDGLRGNNNAGTFTPICDEIADALGSSLNETEAQMMVLETQSLRDALDVQQSYGEGDESNPLDGEHLRVVKRAINAMNLLIGSDPFLEEIDTKVAGPDAENLASPEDQLALADATRQEITSESADRALRVSAKHAPDVPNPSDRKTGLMMRAGLNFVRWSINAFVEHEGKLLSAIVAGTVASIAFAPLATIGGVGTGVLTAWKLAKNIKNNVEKWRRIASQARVTSANFERLVEKINKLPLE